MIREIVIFKDNFVRFYEKQEQKVQRKIEYALDLVRFERVVPKKFYRHITGSDGIWEIRVITTFKSIRLLCFEDKGNLVVLTNCFIKKTKKTPKSEIELAESLKKEYLSEKYGGKK